MIPPSRSAHFRPAELTNREKRPGLTPETSVHNVPSICVVRNRQFAGCVWTYVFKLDIRGDIAVSKSSVGEQ